MNVAAKAAERKKRNNNLKVVEMKHVQVPDIEERLGRVFKILMAHFDSSEDKKPEGVDSCLASL